MVIAKSRVDNNKVVSVSISEVQPAAISWARGTSTTYLIAVSVQNHTANNMLDDWTALKEEMAEHLTKSSPQDDDDLIIDDVVDEEFQPSTM